MNSQIDLTMILVYLLLFLAGILTGYMVRKKSSIGRDEYNGMVEDTGRLKERIQLLEDEKRRLQESLQQQADQNRNYISTNAFLTAENDHLKEKLCGQKEELEKLNQKFMKEFENLAGRALKMSTDDFRKSSGEMIRTLLSPFKEQLMTFQGEVKATRESQIKESATLREQIQNLRQTSDTMMQEAANLTNALKSDSKVRGNWGEMILESILARTGLKEGEEYCIQKTFRDEEGKAFRPDVIVNIPGNRNVVIDSKVQLVAYEASVNAANDQDRERYMKEHIGAVKRHIDDLSKKKYESLYNINSPDFVLMFIAIEPAFTAAMELDVAIYNYAIEKGVVLVTPITLIATLKIIYNIWRQEKQNQNAMVIAETAGRLYDKLHGFLTDMERIDKSLKDAQKSYDEAYKKLSTGKGSALDIADKMKELGAKTKKSIEYEGEGE